MNELPYPESRLYFTLAFMVVVVGAAVLLVRWRFRKQLIAEIATTLGIFLLIIGTIVYTVAFRGLRAGEMVVAWSVSFAAIVWFVTRLNRIMTKPLRELDRLGVSIRRGDWGRILAGRTGSDRGNIAAALRDVAALIEETRRTADTLIEASERVTRVGGEAAGGAQEVGGALVRLAQGAQTNLSVARAIRVTAEEITAASGEVGAAARAPVERHAPLHARGERMLEHALDGRKAGGAGDEQDRLVALLAQVEGAQGSLEADVVAHLHGLEHARREEAAGNQPHVQLDQVGDAGPRREREAALLAVLEQDVDVLARVPAQLAAGIHAQHHLHHVGGEPLHRLNARAVLAHRILLDHSSRLDGATPAQVVDKLLAEVAVQATPLPQSLSAAKIR